MCTPEAFVFPLKQYIFFKIKGCAVIILLIHSEDMVRLQVQRADLTLYGDTEKEKETALGSKVFGRQGYVIRCKIVTSITFPLKYPVVSIISKILVV